jgi:hypothetical protein
VEVARRCGRAITRYANPTTAIAPKARPTPTRALALLPAYVRERTDVTGVRDVEIP